VTVPSYDRTDTPDKFAVHSRSCSAYHAAPARVISSRNARFSDAPMPSPTFITFCGRINEDTAAKIMAALTEAIAEHSTHVHMLWQSYGGFVGDAVALYNFFQSLRVDLTLYNTGTVQSAAVTAYLGPRGG